MGGEGPSVDYAMGKMHVPFRRLRGEGLIHSSTLLRVLRGTHLNNEQALLSYTVKNSVHEQFLAAGKANLNWRDQHVEKNACSRQPSGIWCGYLEHWRGF